MKQIPTVTFDPNKHVVSCREIAEGRQVFVTLQSMMKAEDQIDASAQPQAPSSEVMAVMTDATAAIVALKRQIADLEKRVGEAQEPGAVLYEPDPVTFDHEGHTFSVTQTAYVLLIGWMAQATSALSMGVQGGDYRWHGGEDDFTWPDADGTPVALDAQQLLDLGKAANAHFAK